jgi:hypothetical protein
MKFPQPFAVSLFDAFIAISLSSLYPNLGYEKNLLLYPPFSSPGSLPLAFRRGLAPGNLTPLSPRMSRVPARQPGKPE